MSSSISLYKLRKHFNEALTRELNKHKKRAALSTIYWIIQVTRFLTNLSPSNVSHYERSKKENLKNTNKDELLLFCYLYGLAIHTLVSD